MHNLRSTNIKNTIGQNNLILIKRDKYKKAKLEIIRLIENLRIGALE